MERLLQIARLSMKFKAEKPIKLEDIDVINLPSKSTNELLKVFLDSCLFTFCDGKYLVKDQIQQTRFYETDPVNTCLKSSK